MQSSNSFHIIEDVKRLYAKLRRIGKSRSDAVAEIKEIYAAELQDSDDRVAVIIGVALALCKKQELTQGVSNEALREIQIAAGYLPEEDKRRQYYIQTGHRIADRANYGPEAKYSQRSPYVPDWKVGDTFCHTLLHPAAESLGILGWSIILHKAGEHTDNFGQHRQLMYVTICPPEKEPTDSSELQALGFIPMMRYGAKADYLAQITLKSKKDELAFGLTKIGHFPGIIPPADQMNEKPLTAMPLFGCIQKDDTYPAFEDQLCRLYRKLLKA